MTIRYYHVNLDKPVSRAITSLYPDEMRAKVESLENAKPSQRQNWSLRYQLGLNILITSAMAFDEYDEISAVQMVNKWLGRKRKQPTVDHLKLSMWLALGGAK